MARKKKPLSKDQNALFDDGKKKDVVVHDGQKGKETGLVHPEKTIPKGPVVKPKLYTGLDIDGLIEKFSEIAEKHGAEYTSESWGGSGTLTLTPKVEVQVNMFIEEMVIFCRKYDVNASLSGRVNFAVEGDPFLQVKFVVPGRITSGKVSG